MLKKNSNTIHTAKAPAEYFTGNAWLDTLVKNDTIKCNVAKVTFEPSARNHWHTHLAGQVLLATVGKGYVQKRGEPIQLLLPGDVVIILPGEEHWHGAAPDSIFTHIAIQPLSEKGEEIFWLKAVTDEEYNEAISKACCHPELVSGSARFGNRYQVPIYRDRHDDLDCAFETAS